MEKKEKRKTIGIAILVACIAVFIVVFLVFRSWLHSDGMHFVGGYGQVHMSHRCKGIDQDGNEIDSQNVTVDGVVTLFDGDGVGRFKGGEINIDDLLEKNGLFTTSLAGAIKEDGGVYRLFGCLFIESPVWRESHEEEFGNRENEEEETGGGDAYIWMKDGQVAVEFHLGDMHNDQYYLLYSDKEMLKIPAIREKLPKGVA